MNFPVPFPNSHINNLMFHGTQKDFDQLDISQTKDGGIHFGTHHQALKRSAGRNQRIIQAYININRPKRLKDIGGNWAYVIKAAKKSGYDSIIYLNRYEGIPFEQFDSYRKKGYLRSLDKISDLNFQKLIPEARDSIIVFENHQIRQIPDHIPIQTMEAA